MESSQSTEKKTVHNAQSYQHENPSKMVPSRPSFPSSPHLDTKLKSRSPGIVGTKHIQGKCLESSIAILQ